MATAVKLSDQLADAARREARIASRSMAQQLEYWARLGRAFDSSGAISRDRVRSALKAQLEFDELTAEERVAAFSVLDEAVVRPDGDAALAARLAESEFSSGLDAAGNLVRYAADGTATTIDDADAYYAESLAQRQDS